MHAVDFREMHVLIIFRNYQTKIMESKVNYSKGKLKLYIVAQIIR